MTDCGRMRLNAASAMDYEVWLSDVKARVRATQVRAARAANVEVLKLYWSIGHDILERQRDFGWGAKIIEQISKDLSHEFPGQRGFSRTNLEYMRRFADAWPMLFRFPPRRVGENNGDAPANSEEMADSAIVPHSVGELPTVSELPWGHIRILLDRLKTPVERDWYAERAAVEGWKRSVLEHYIAVGLMRQIGAAPSNFAQAL